MSTHSVLFSNIKIAPNRQRREFDSTRLTQLADSIAAIGLLHPPVVRQTAPQEYELVAGERRLRAIAMNAELGLPIKYGDGIYVDDMVPVTLISDLSSDAAFEAELEENVNRVDLTWQERAQAEAQLHARRTAQAETAGLVQHVRTTASEIVGHLAQGSEVTAVAENIILAKHLDDPDIAKASSKKEAIKILDKKKRIEQRAQLATMFDQSNSKHTLLKGDSLVLLESIESESIDVILTDPPYGVDASSFGSNFAAMHEYEDSPEYFERLVRECAREFNRVAKREAHFYIFCSFDGFARWRAALMEYFQVWQQPLIWAKGNGNAPWLEGGPRKTYECIVYARKGDRKCLAVKNDVIAISPPADREHGAEKPVDLYVELLSRSALPGNTVLDPFAGSGTIFPAANRAKCRAIGIEINPDYYNLALERMMNHE